MRWAQKLSTARVVEQTYWSRPNLNDWVGRLIEEINLCERPVLILAHSLGVVTLAHTVARFDGAKIAGAFLVAPPSEAAVSVIESIDPAFTPYPTTPLPFPTVLIASQNDPFCSYEEATRLAAAWGSDLTDAGEAGHINAESGHGPWPEGLMKLASFLRQL